MTAPLVNGAGRRFLGRPESVRPAPITCDATAVEKPPLSAHTHDDLGPARGIAAALLLVLLFLCVITFFVL